MALPTEPRTPLKGRAPLLLVGLEGGVRKREGALHGASPFFFWTVFNLCSTLWIRFQVQARRSFLTGGRHQEWVFSW